MSDDAEMQGIRKRMHDMSNMVQNLVTRDATMAVQVSNLVTMFQDHRADSKTFMGDATEKLGEIADQVTKTNGRVNGHDREISDLKDTVTWAIRLIVGLNVTVIGGVVIGVVVYLVTRK